MEQDISVRPYSLALGELERSATQVAERSALHKIQAFKFGFYYGKFQALSDINVSFAERRITSIIGPSGVGKSTFLRAINRMRDMHPNARNEGELFVDGEDIYGNGVNPVLLRRR